MPSSTCNLKASFPPSSMPLRCREPRTALFSKSPNTWVATTSAPSLLTQLRVSFVDKLSWTLVTPSWCPLVPRLLAESLMLSVNPSTKEVPLKPTSTAPSTEKPLHSSSKVPALRCLLPVSNNPFRPNSDNLRVKTCLNNRLKNYRGPNALAVHVGLAR